MEHLIIVIGRQLGSGGRIVARKLAERFGCKFYDREILNLAAKESGFCEKFFERNDENKGFFKALYHLHLPHITDGNFYANKFSEESLFQFQSDAIRHAAAEGNCVFVGRAADYVLRDVPETINIFITADMEERIKRVMERHQCDKPTARKIIHEKESERAKFYNYYTGKQWGNASSYDICVNSTKLGIDGTVEMLTHFIEESRK
ncbi:MAG: cytidylate kinase-like family protein [Prevotella sp.]|jgi:cytidylate kinase|nr:cytidylate kinase-like family protein [Prevotella sp.]MBR1622022.1 cytidylate kinase-like family protein [Prevotella sp.]